MPIINQWDNDEKTIYTFIMRGTWEWADFQDALRKGYEQIKGVSHAVDVVYVYVSELPQGDAVQYMMLASEAQPKNCHRSVIVNPGRDILKMIVGAIDNMNQWEGPKFVDTLEEARMYLADEDNK